MKIPKKIKLLDSEYTVIVTEPGALGNSWGHFDYGRREIRLDGSLKAPGEVLFHELAHLIAKHLELSTLFDKDHEELISNAYAAGFYSLFKNNKGMFK